MLNPSRISYFIGVFILLAPVLTTAQVNVDSLLQVASAIDDKNERLVYFDSLCSIVPKQGYHEDIGRVFEARVDLAEAEMPLDVAVVRAIDAGDLYLTYRRGEDAERIVDKFMNRKEELQNLAVKMDLLDIRASIYGSFGQSKSAIELYKEMLAMEDEEAQILAPMRTWLNLGRNQYRSGQFDQSSLSLNKAREIAIANNDSIEISYAYIELGILFGQIGLYEVAMEYFKERYKYLKSPSEFDVVVDFVNFGNGELLLKRYEKAIEYFHEGLAHKPYSPEISYMELYFLVGLVEGHFLLDNRDSVIYYHHELAKVDKRIADSEYYKGLRAQSTFFYQLTKMQYASAEKTIDKLYQDAIERKNPDDVSKYANFYSLLYQRWGKPQSALTYLLKHKKVSDSINSSNSNNALLLYQTQYETAEKENKIQSLQQEKIIQEIKAKSTRNRYLLTGGILLLLTAFLFFYQRTRNKINRVAQIEQLRSKISSDLHDDVGSLLTGLAMQSELLEAQTEGGHKQRVTRISELSRSAMSRMRDAVWAMDAKRDNWGSLIDRMNEFAADTLSARDIKYVITADSIAQERRLSGEFRQHIYLIFKEAIANVAKHSDGSAVDVKLDFSDGVFVMEIHDNGTPSDKKINTSGQGLGNMKSRAEKIGADLQIANEAGFVIKLVCPFGVKK